MRRRQLADDQVVRIFDHVLDHLIGQRAIDHDGVPVALVQVVARDHPRVRLAKLLGNVGLAFEAHAQWVLSSSRDSANIFPATLKTEVALPNGNVSAEPGNDRQCR